MEQIFKTIGSRETPNKEYSDNWFLHTPLKEEYNTTSVLDLYVDFLDLEAIEKKESEDKKKKEQARIDEIERLHKEELIKKAEADRVETAKNARHLKAQNNKNNGDETTEEQKSI